MPHNDGFPEVCLICGVRPIGDDPVCDVCLQNAGQYLVENADLIGAAADLERHGWALTEAVRAFIGDVPYGGLPPELLRALGNFDAALNKASGG